MTIDERAAKTYKGLIVSNPAVMTGKLVIAGTRITAELILDAHPRLSREAILAALAFAANALRADVVYPFVGTTP